MKTATERIQARLKKNRQMITISIRMPETLIEELKELAPELGFSGYQPLLRAYVGQGMRKDQAQLEGSSMKALRSSLRRKGVSDRIISAAVSESKQKLA